MDNYNYPMGADTPDAPWNQRDPEPIDIDAEITVLLKGKVNVTTDQYSVSSCDEDGSNEIDLFATYKDIEDAYNKQCYSIPYLLCELSKYIISEINDGNISKSRKQYLEGLLNDCKQWEVLDIEVEEFSIRS